MTATVVGPGGEIEIDNSDGTPIEVTVVGGVALAGEVEVKNDVGNPVPVAARLFDEVGTPFSAGNPLHVDVGGNIQINNLTVNFESVLSTGNIPPAPLAANELFVGAWEEVKNYASIAIAVYTDAYSTADGAAAQFSDDGVNVIREERATLIGGLPSYFEIPPESQYFRIVVQNGPVAQTFLEASIIYRFNPPGLIHSPLATPSDDLDISGSTKAHLFGRHTAGAVGGIAPFVGVQVDAAGQVYVRGTDLEVALDAATLSALEEVGLDAATLAALETVGLDAATLAALETVGLDAATLAALESITVQNQPTDFPDQVMAGKTPDLSGTWGYNAGVDGTVVLAGSKRVIGIAAHATLAASFTINGGDAIPVPANSGIEIVPLANLIDPTIVFAGTDSYFVEHLV